MESYNLTKDQLFNENKSLKAQLAELKDLDHKRNLAINALKISEDKMLGIYRVAPTGMGMLKKRFFVEVNPLVCKMTGYSEKELVGKNTSILYPTDKEFEYVGKEKYRQISKYGTGTVEAIWKKKDGSLINVLLASTPLDINDLSKEIVFTVLDVTERRKTEEDLRKSEERFRQVVENSQEWIWEVDLNGMYTFASKASLKIFGYLPEEIVQKKYFYEWFHPDVREGLKRKISGLFRQKKSFTNLISRCLAKNGNEVWISTGGVPIFNSRKELVGYRGAVTNITKQKAVQDKLKKSKEKFSKGFLTSPDSIFVARLSDGYFESVNNSFTQLFEYTLKEVVGESTISLNIWENLKDRDKVVLMLNENGTIQNFEIGLRSKSGVIKECSMSATIIEIESVPHLLCMIRDISKRLEAEKILRKKEQRLAQHINQTPLGVIEWDLDFKVKKWNPSAERIFGYSGKEAIGNYATFIFPLEDTKKVEILWKELTSSNGRKRSTNQNIKKNGKAILCEWYNTQLVNEDGEVIAIASLVRDISERVRSEQIQKVLYNISNAVNTTDNLYRLIGFMRKELGRILDTTNFYIALYNEKEDTLSLPFFVDEKDKFTSIPAGKTLTKYVIDTKKSLLADVQVMSDLENCGKIESVGSDSKVWLGVPLKKDSKITGVLAVQSYTNENAFNGVDMQMLEFVSDQISLSIHRKKTEEELIEALKKAEESDRLKTAFLQNMSHEIRTPMNGILGFTSLLKEPGLNSNEQQEYLQIIEKSGDRMLNTINDLMNISKIEAGQMNVEKAEVNINELIDYIQTFFQLEAEQKGLKLTCEKGLLSDAIINSDKEKLYAILTNLVKNAIKYTENGTVDFGYHKKNHDFEFFVKDTGIGIPEGKLDLVFDRFVQVHENLTSGYEGTGLGLSITKAYVELLGGRIRVKSNYGAGTTFLFEIPEKTNISEPEIEKRETVAVGLDEDKYLKILIAEDDETIGTYLSIVVKKVAKKIFFAENGIEAVEICKNNPDLDLILMDIKMPEMDGHRATQKIREFNSKVIIIAQTAFALESERDKAILVGCNDYITKPISRFALIEIIGKYF